MVKERRSAAEALVQSADFLSFVSGGAVTSDTSKEVSHTSTRTQSKEEEEEASAPEPDRPSLSVEQARPAKRKPRKRTDDDVSRAEFVRTMSKATIQKTVRFDPRLIARLEDLNAKQDKQGERPKSFQQIQNEALRQWLDSNEE